MLYAGEFFPSADAVVSIIKRKGEAKRLEAAEIKQNQKAYWDKYERNSREVERFMEVHDGKTPAQVWCEQNKAELARLNALMKCSPRETNNVVVAD